MTEDGALEFSDLEALFERWRTEPPRYEQVFPYINMVPRRLWCYVFPLDECRYWAVELGQRPLSPEEEARWA
jgi:hypothetical protein